jgi:tetratricopeptide (TPR) repeat protein
MTHPEASNVKIVSTARLPAKVLLGLCKAAVTIPALSVHAEAAKVWTEALVIFRRLAAANPGALELGVAQTLNNLGVLYQGSSRHNEAEKALTEALDLFRKFAAVNPAIYELEVAMTLNYLASIYVLQKELQKAEKYSIEAERILIPWWKADPIAHADDMVRILSIRAFILSSSGDGRSAQDYAHRALEAARDPA